MRVRVRRQYIGEKHAELKLLLENPFHQKPVPLWQEVRTRAEIQRHTLTVEVLHVQVKGYCSLHESLLRI